MPLKAKGTYAHQGLKPLINTAGLSSFPTSFNPPSVPFPDLQSGPLPSTSFNPPSGPLPLTPFMPPSQFVSLSGSSVRSHNFQKWKLPSGGPSGQSAASTPSKKEKARVPIMENMVTVSSNLKDAMVAVQAVQSTMQPMPLSQGITAAINFMDNHKNVPESPDPWLLGKELCQMLCHRAACRRARELPGGKSECV